MINEIKFDKGENEGIMRNSVIPPNQPEGDFALAGGKRSKSRKIEEDKLFIQDDHILSINYERSN